MKATDQAPEVGVTGKTTVSGVTTLLSKGRFWRYAEPVLVLLLTFTGFFLRRWHIGYAGLWFDEADLARIAQQPIGTIMHSFIEAEQNGPLYILFMHGWIFLFGDSEIALRTPSFIFGGLTIPALYLLGRKIYNEWLGFTAALLLMISPFHIWYSQETKMYALVGLSATISSYIFLQALEKRKTRWWVAYTVTMTLFFYIHLTMILFLIAQILYYLIVHFWKEKETRRGWLISTGILTIPYFLLGIWEIVQFFLNPRQSWGWYQSIGLIDMIGTIYQSFTIDWGGTDSGYLRYIDQFTGFVFALLLGAGLLRLRGKFRMQGEGRRVYLLITLFLPPIFFYIISLIVPIFSPRYLMLVLPSFLLLAASGLVWLWENQRIIATIALLFIVIPSGISLQNYNYISNDQSSQKEEWKQAATYIAAHIRKDDVIIVEPAYVIPAFSYYWDRLPHEYKVPIVYLRSSHAGKDNFAELDKEIPNPSPDNPDLQIAWNKQRAWLVTSPDRLLLDDPDQNILHWFQYNSFIFEDHLYNGVSVQGFSFNWALNNWYPPSQYPIFPRINFGNEITLKGYDYDMAKPDLTMGRTTVKAGDYIKLTLSWGYQCPDADFKIKIDLVDAQGNSVISYNPPIAPLNGHWSTSKWCGYSKYLGTEIKDYYENLYVRPTPPGNYYIRVKVVDVNLNPLKIIDNNDHSTLHDSYTLTQTLTIQP